MRKAIMVTVSVVAIGSITAELLASASPGFSDTREVPMLAAAQSHHGEGTVTAIDKKDRRIELKHGPIKSLGWMGMKMYFDVDNADLLEKVTVGDKVDFKLIQTRDERFVITDIEVK